MSAPTWDETVPTWDDTLPDDNYSPAPATAPAPSRSGSFPEASDVLSNPDRGVMGKAWDMLQVPSQMSKRGLDDIASRIPAPEPTGNRIRDIATNTPRIAAETMAETAPAFINRLSLLMGGGARALKEVSPLIKYIGTGVARQGDQISGAAPGTMETVAKDASLWWAKTRKEVSPLYEAAKTTPKGANIFNGLYKVDDIINKAKAFQEAGGDLSKIEPDEGLILRKALRAAGRSRNVVPDMLVDMTEEADTAAKSSDLIAKADPLHKRAIMGESLRNIVPQNKYGGASSFKLALMTALAHAGRFGKVAGALMSPMGIGVAATGTGMASRVMGPVVTNASAAVTLKNVIESYYARRNQPNE